MKTISLLLLFVITNIYTGYSQKYRWDVKILIDTAGLRIFKNKAQPETINNLASKKNNPRPGKEEIKKGLRAESEKRKVTVKAYVIGLGKEDDGDYHLVLKDLKNKKTLVGEIPDPEGVKLKGFPTYKKLYGKARNNVDNNIQVPTSSIKDIQPVKVKITGIVFFDIFEEGGHGTGTALENAVEIHPILSLEVIK